MARFDETCQGVVAIDGKMQRRSVDKASGKSALHMVSAWGTEQRLVLARLPPMPSRMRSPRCPHC